MHRSLPLPELQQASRLAAAALLLALPAAAQGTLYRVLPANSPAGSLLSQATAINPQGDLAGIAVPPTGQGFLGFADEGAGPRLMQPLPGHDSSQPFRFFRNGRAIGMSSDSVTGVTQAAVWTPGAMPLPLRILPGYTSSFTTGANGHSEIVGWCSEAVAPSTVPVLWRHGVLERLPLPPGMTDAQAAANNNRGTIVGFGSSAGGPPTAFVMERNGKVQLVQPLPGGLFSQLVDVNQTGAAVGTSDVMGSLHAVRWEKGVLTDLGVAAGHDGAFLFMINRGGQAVGVGIAGMSLAAVVTVGNQVVDINTVLDPASAGWQVLIASDLNNSGQISATAMSATGQLVAVVLDPVKVPLGVTPTPATPSRRPVPDEARRMIEESLRLRLGPLARIR